jgi:hypothetical protein
MSVYQFDVNVGDVYQVRHDFLRYSAPGGVNIANQYIKCFSGDVLICLDVTQWLSSSGLTGNAVNLTFLHADVGLFTITASQYADAWVDTYLRRLE